MDPLENHFLITNDETLVTFINQSTQQSGERARSAKTQSGWVVTKGQRNKLCCTNTLLILMCIFLQDANCKEIQREEKLWVSIFEVRPK
jgi:hypothetical protein